MAFFRKLLGRDEKHREDDEPIKTSAAVRAYPDALPIKCTWRERHTDSLREECPILSEFEDKHKDVDIGLTYEHSEAKINTSQDPAEPKFESLGFSIKSHTERANTYHFLHSSKEEDSAVPHGLRQGDQILSLVGREKDGDKTVVFTTHVMGIASHDEVMETFKSLNCTLHIFTLIVRRIVNNGKIMFFEVTIIVEKTDGEMRIVVIETEVLSQGTIPGTKLAVLKISPLEPVNIQVYNSDSSQKAIRWNVLNNKMVVLGEGKEEPEDLPLERLVMECYDMDVGAIVFLNAFRIRHTDLFITVNMDHGKPEVAVKKHKLKSKKGKVLPKGPLFKHANDHRSYSSFESLEAEGYFIAAGCDSRLTLVKPNAIDLTCSQTTHFQLMFDKETRVSRQKATETSRGNSVWGAWKIKLKFWKSATTAH